MDRRSVLATIGAVGIAAGSGCLDPFRYLGSELRVPWLAIDNETPESRQIDVRLDRDGTTVHNSSHTLDSGERTVIECTWEDVEGAYAVAGRLTDGEWKTLRVENQFQRLPDCAVVTLECHPVSTGPDFFLYARALCESYGTTCTDTASANGTESDSTRADGRS
jgi:hypothetical protein